jgi:Domain of unknown function (DUF4760)
MINWQADEAIATIVSSIAIVAGAIFVVIQLRQAARDRYFTITANLFEIWQSSQFQNDQLFLLHKLNAVSWDEFVANGRGERAERAIHRVAGFYDRVGNLIRNGLIREDDILPTVGGFAIAVWQRIEPIVQEARRRENAFLFQNFEAVLPNCRECYVPVAADIQTVTALAEDVERIGPQEAKRLVDQDAAVMLDVSKQPEGKKIKGAVRANPNDLTGWLTVVPRGKAVITYCT